MTISNSIIQNLNEKASIDWNNYLTPEEVNKFLSKDDKVESAEDIIYSNDFNPRYKDFSNDLQKQYNNAWTKDELVHDLVNFYENGNLIESDLMKEDNHLDLWKSQINGKNEEELTIYLSKLYNQLLNYNKNDSSIKSNKYELILQKINYIENTLGLSDRIGRKLH